MHVYGSDHLMQDGSGGAYEMNRSTRLKARHECSEINRRGATKVVGKFTVLFWKAAVRPSIFNGSIHWYS